MKKKTLVNLVFTLAVLAAAGALFLLQGLNARQGRTARLEYGSSGQVQEFDLNRDARYDLDTGLYTIHLEVRDGAIRFVDSPCPDHSCEGFGWLSEEGQWAACLPAQAMLQVQ